MIRFLFTIKHPLHCLAALCTLTDVSLKVALHKLNIIKMSRKTFSMMFMIRRGQLLKNQEAPIYLRITMNGECAEISIKRSIPPERWDEFRKKAKPGSASAKELNMYLEQIRHKVYEHQRYLIDKNKVVSATSLKNAYLNVEDDEHRTILQVYEEHNENMKLRINKGSAKNTYIRHTTSKMHLERFI